MNANENEYIMCVPVSETLPATIKYARGRIESLKSELKAVSDMIAELTANPQFYDKQYICDYGLDMDFRELSVKSSAANRSLDAMIQACKVIEDQVCGDAYDQTASRDSMEN